MRLGVIVRRAIVISPIDRKAWDDPLRGMMAGLEVPEVRKPSMRLHLHPAAD